MMDDFIRMLREITTLEARLKIGYNQRLCATVGRVIMEHATDRQNAIHNKVNIQRNQLANKKLSIWRNRHRTTIR